MLTDLSPSGAGIYFSGSTALQGEKITVVIQAPFFFEQAVSREATMVWCRKVDVGTWRCGLNFPAHTPLDFSTQ